MRVEIDDKTPSDLFPVSKSETIFGICGDTVRGYAQHGLVLFKIGTRIFASRSQLEKLIKSHPVSEKPKEPTKKFDMMTAREHLEAYQEHLKKYKAELDAGITTSTAPRACDHALTTEQELWCARKLQMQIFDKLLEETK